jgi:hypothetical protein
MDDNLNIDQLISETFGEEKTLKPSKEKHVQASQEEEYDIFDEEDEDDKSRGTQEEVVDFPEEEEIVIEEKAPELQRPNNLYEQEERQKKGRKHLGRNERLQAKLEQKEETLAEVLRENMELKSRMTALAADADKERNIYLSNTFETNEAALQLARSEHETQMQRARANGNFREEMDALKEINKIDQYMERIQTQKQVGRENKYSEIVSDTLKSSKSNEYINQPPNFQPVRDWMIENPAVNPNHKYYSPRLRSIADEEFDRVRDYYIANGLEEEIGSEEFVEAADKLIKDRWNSEFNDVKKAPTRTKVQAEDIRRFRSPVAGANTRSYGESSGEGDDSLRYTVSKIREKYPHAHAQIEFLASQKDEKTRRPVGYAEAARRFIQDARRNGIKLV